MSDLRGVLLMLYLDAPGGCHLTRKQADELGAEFDRLTSEHEAMARHLEGVQATWDGCDSERMKLRAEVVRLKAFIADKIHDASRERTLMEIDYRGNHV